MSARLLAVEATSTASPAAAPCLIRPANADASSWRVRYRNATWPITSAAVADGSLTPLSIPPDHAHLQLTSSGTRESIGQTSVDKQHAGSGKEGARRGQHKRLAIERDDTPALAGSSAAQGDS